MRIIHKFSNSLLATYQFEVEPVVASEKVTGIVEIKGSNWLVPKPVVEQDLSPNNSVEKGMWDTIYSVYVVPDVDVRVKVGGANFSKMMPIFLFALAVTGIALAVLFAVGF